MKVLNSVLLMSFMSLCYSCNGQHTAPLSTKSIEINNKGAESLTKYQEGGKDELNKAIVFFKDAIQCDSNYLFAHINLATAYDYEKNYKKELSVYNKILNISKNDPSVLTEKGIVFEKLKQIDSAKELYQSARQKFKERLALHPNNLNAIKGFLLLLALIEGKESALQELDRRSALDPVLASKMASEYYFYQNFSKPTYIYHLSQ